MRLVRLVGSVCALVVAVAACGEKQDKGPAKKASSTSTAAQDDELKKAQADLLARRDELMRERKELAERKAQLAQRRQQGGDTSAEEAELLEVQVRLDRQQAELEQKETVLIQQIAVSGDSEDVARREAALALREAAVARREDRVAQREGDLAAREKAQAQREKETCGVPTTTTIVQTVAPPSGSKYSKRDVEPILQKARRKMAEKGLLASDLPPPAQELEREATQAMADGEYGKAKFAADQLLATVDSIKIDKAFIAGKINRLNAAMRGKQLTPEIQELFRAATADYGDGKFAAANAKLNKIYGMIR